MPLRARIALGLAVATTVAWALVLGVLLPLEIAGLVAPGTLRVAGCAAFVLMWTPLVACPRRSDLDAP